MRVFLSTLLIFFSISILFAQDPTPDYISKYSSLAIKNMKSSGIPASITLAQGILESGSGQSKLAKKANNHFGIKCGGNWHGKKVYMDDDAKDECFRKYRKVKQSYQDHCDFISKRDRYAFLFELDRTDYKGWAKGLKKAGYATNPNYPDLLINLIEKYDLERFDKKGKSKKAKVKSSAQEQLIAHGSKPVRPAGGLSAKKRFGRYCIVQKGETLYSIAQRYNLSVEELKSLNNLSSDTVSKGQRLRVSP